MQAKRLLSFVAGRSIYTTPRMNPAFPGPSVYLVNAACKISGYTNMMDDIERPMHTSSTTYKKATMPLKPMYRVSSPPCRESALGRYKYKRQRISLKGNIVKVMCCRYHEMAPASFSLEWCDQPMPKISNFSLPNEFEAWDSTGEDLFCNCSRGSSIKDRR